MVSKRKVLLIGPRPRELAELNIKSEIQLIRSRINEVGGQLDLIDELGVAFGDLTGLLYKHEPEILHITAHGSKDGYLAFETDHGETHAVPIDSLRRLLRTYAQKGTLRCIVFNSCHMGKLAQSLTEFVDYVVASPRELLNKAGIAFSGTFYQMMSLEESIETCFQMALSNSTAWDPKEGEYRIYFRGDFKKNDFPDKSEDFYQNIAPSQKKSLIFIISVPEDKKYLKELITRLKPWADRGIIEYWEKSMMPAGSIREDWLKEKLGKAQLIILGVSADALADDEWNMLTERAMDKFQRKRAQVVPLRIRPISFAATRFEHLGCLPSDGKSISAHLQNGHEEIWNRIIEEVLALLKNAKSN